jgi:murein DD-endopeptidase MepM/ murein hydrolase activator NlpD
VVAIQEGRSEEVPLQPVEGVHVPGDYGGNAVTLEIAPGGYAFYAHLQPDSITVAVGDHVSTGQVLGLLGNTGNATAPHLHFGLIDDPDPLVGASLPMAFAQWTPESTILPDVYRSTDPRAGVPDLTPQGTPSEQSGTLQLFLDVAAFG